MTRELSTIYLIALACFALALWHAPVSADRKNAPQDLPGSTVADAKWIKSQIDQKKPLLIIDSRIEDEYMEGHLPGAVHLNVDNTDEYQQVLPADKDHPILFYCNGPKCLMSHKAAMLALQMGYRNVFWFRGGIPEWSGSGYPLE